MAYKPEIQYIGQFYVHGSEAKALQQKTAKKQAKYTLPLQRLKNIRKIHVDALAICSIALCVVMTVALVVGIVQMQSAWHELEVAQEYRMSLEKVNRTLSVKYHSGYDPEQVREAALAMGMVPVSELATREITVSVPVPEKEPTLLEDILWFVKGLLA